MTAPAPVGPSATPEVTTGARGGKSRARAIIGFIIGIALLAAAAWAVASQAEALQQARESVRSAPPWLLVLALLFPLLNWLVISGSFWIMMRRYGRIGYGEMVALIGAAWLLNYLPLRAGLIGRVAYHRTVNNIRIADSLRVTIMGLIFAGISMGIMLLAAVVLAGEGPWQIWTGILTAPLALAGAAAVAISARGSTAWWLPVAFGLRYLDSLLWTLRYLVVFALVGSAIDLSGAVAISAVSQVAILIPIVPNGLGLREWAVGFTAAALPAHLIDGDGQLLTAIGVAADLVNRAAELLIAIPAGLLATWALARRHRQRSAVVAQSPAEPPAPR